MNLPNNAVGLCAGRHDIPVGKYIFTEVNDVLDFHALNRTAGAFIKANCNIRLEYGAGISQTTLSDTIDGKNLVLFVRFGCLGQVMHLYVESSGVNVSVQKPAVCLEPVKHHRLRKSVEPSVCPDRHGDLGANEAPAKTSVSFGQAFLFLENTKVKLKLSSVGIHKVVDMNNVSVFVHMLPPLEVKLLRNVLAVITVVVPQGQGHTVKCTGIHDGGGTLGQTGNNDVQLVSLVALHVNVGVSSGDGDFEMWRDYSDAKESYDSFAIAGYPDPQLYKVLNCDAEPAKENDWIPVSSGELPEEYKTVHVTFLGYNDNAPYCDMCAYRIGKNWFWAYNEESICVKITAWKPICEPYKEESK